METKSEREKAIEVFKWILYNVNGYSKEDLDTIDYDRAPEVNCLLSMMVKGCKYNDYEARL